MNRILLILLVVSALAYGCGKSGADPVVHYRAQAVIDDKIVSDYLSSHTSLNAKKVDTSGVYYIVNPGEEGSGNVLFTSSTSVTVGFTGRLLTTGNVFIQTGNFHPSYILSTVIRGWQLGIPQIKTGGTVRLLIPSRYAYGPFPQDSLHLPANAVLDFTIKLYNVSN